MVRITLMLARNPVIKFRKGGLGPQHAAPATSTAPAAASSRGSAPQLHQATGMSTSAVPDFDLPLRYRRAPLSQEEIDHINGGGIV